MVEVPHDIVNLIIDELYESKTISTSAACGKHGIKYKDFYKTLQQYPELEISYEHARKARGEALVDEIVEISDTEADPQRARNMIDTRKWYASKMLPQKYGDRLDINHTQIFSLSTALNDALKRSQLPMCYPEKVIEAQEPEYLITIPHRTTDNQSGETRDAIKNESDDIFE